jgi:hypothetical protein
MRVAKLAQVFYTPVKSTASRYRLVAPSIDNFVANHFLVKYRTGTEIPFSAQSRALETNNSQSCDSMSTMWRSQ